MSYNAGSAILGNGTVSAEAIQAWLESQMSWGARVVGLPPVAIPADMGRIIVEESARYPSHVVNHDLVASQINHESAACQSRIARDKRNYSGYGAENDDPYGKAFTFSTPRDGVRTQIAHLLGYVVGDGPWNVLSPRYSIVKGKGWDGTVNVLHELEQKWAYTGAASYAVTPKENRYGAKIATHANRLLAFANDGSWNKETPMDAQIPGFTWRPADGEHYQKGRGQAIRGGAQHYTAGSNSLGWLTSDSGRDDPDARVSATFLVKKNATLSDRGWQLVRVEDTSWTTGGIVNPYTVAIEYEHKSGQPITDTDYEVLAVTWADITRYVRTHGLGDIGIVRGHREWTGNNSTVCPDGIDVVRIERRRKELLTDAQPPKPAPDSRTFNVPGLGSFTLSGGFLLFWEARGGIEVFGFPLSDELKEDGMTVQYFERARFEWHPGAVPESWDVLLTRLGADALERKTA